MTTATIVACPASPTGFVELQPYAAHYDASAITAEDIERDPAIRVVDEGERTHQRVARAAAHIDATELADGRWAHYADETSSWHVITSDELESLCDYLDSADADIASDAYSHWCAGTSATEMPRGWHP